MWHIHETLTDTITPGQSVSEKNRNEYPFQRPHKSKTKPFDMDRVYIGCPWNSTYPKKWIFYGDDRTVQNTVSIFLALVKRKR